MELRKKWNNSTKTRTYYAWRSMRSRCYNESNPSWTDYGGRGIQVCDRWRNDFDAFVADMGLAPESKSLDRIEVNKDYTPDNCRWATAKEQANNRRYNVKLTYNGETLTCAEWAALLGIGPDTIWRRMHVYKMPIDKVLTQGRINMWRHGTRAGYERHKCKCDSCRNANTERHRVLRKK